MSYIGDDAVISLLSQIIENIRNSVYNQEQCQEIYECNEEYVTGDRAIDPKAIEYLMKGWYITQVMRCNE